ncbi:hypothetical protein PAXRUDRAFT_149261, partial [Paxillus rubicundulus Ve08.2h10]
NLTLADWKQVYSFIDAHPDAAQAQIVQHFSPLKTNAHQFNQSTLSCKLWECPKMEACVDNNPTALSSKRPHIVTSPAVQHALIYWICHMEAKGNTDWSNVTREVQEIEGKTSNSRKGKACGGWVGVIALQGL